MQYYTDILHVSSGVKFLYKEVDIQYTDILHEVTGRKRSVLRHMAVGSFDISTFTNRMFVRKFVKQNDSNNDSISLTRLYFFAALNMHFSDILKQLF